MTADFAPFDANEKETVLFAAPMPANTEAVVVDAFLIFKPQR
jgi:hypothetical protein